MCPIFVIRDSHILYHKITTFEPLDSYNSHSCLLCRECVRPHMHGYQVGRPTQNRTHVLCSLTLSTPYWCLLEPPKCMPCPYMSACNARCGHPSGKGLLLKDLALGATVPQGDLHRHPVLLLVPFAFAYCNLFERQ